MMQCESPQNSFHVEGGDWTFVYNLSPGILWGDLLASWEQGPRNERCLCQKIPLLRSGLVSCDKYQNMLHLGGLVLYTSGK